MTGEKGAQGRAPAANACKRGKEEPVLTSCRSERSTSGLKGEGRGLAAVATIVAKNGHPYNRRRRKAPGSRLFSLLGRGTVTVCKSNPDESVFYTLGEEGVSLI